MNAARALPLILLAFAAFPARAADPFTVDPDSLWIVSGHGVNLSQIADDADGAFAVASHVGADEVPHAAERAKLGALQNAVAQLQTPGEHVLPAGFGPGGGNPTLVAARLLSQLGAVDARTIDLVIGIDPATGRTRSLVRVRGDDRLFDPETAERAPRGFLPLYSVGSEGTRIHVQSDAAYRPPIDRSALDPFGRHGEGSVTALPAGTLPPGVIARLAPAGP